MSPSERDASVGAIKDALGWLGALQSYPNQRRRLDTHIERIAERPGLPEEIRVAIRSASVAELYALRKSLVGAQITEEE